MGYLRLFIELRNEVSGENAGQARIELQDRPGRIDVKVRGALMGLKEGDTYQAALVSESMGAYREYPLGQCVVNMRGQASLLHRASLPLEPGDALGIGNFKAFVARCGGKRVVGYRFEKLIIPDSYEQPLRPQMPEAAEADEAAEAAAMPPVKEPETVQEVQAEQKAGGAPKPEAASEETVLEEAPEGEPAMEPVIEQETAERSGAVAAMPVSRPLPEPVYVLHDLNEVDRVCGEAGKRAFQRYHHLILIQQENESLLGMPCRYRPSGQEELEADGYREFLTPHGGAPSYGEFGYWVKRL